MLSHHAATKTTALQRHFKTTEYATEHDLPVLQVGDIVEVSTDGKCVYWTFQRA
jgi:hypothetical protein